MKNIFALMNQWKGKLLIQSVKNLTGSGLESNQILFGSTKNLDSLDKIVWTDFSLGAFIDELIFQL